jgi:hypothetical protein
MIGCWEGTAVKRCESARYLEKYYLSDMIPCGGERWIMERLVGLFMEVWQWVVVCGGLGVMKDGVLT